jgi:hypothetical protein
MKLAQAQADRFFALWFPLLSYVNEERHLVPDRPVAGGSPPFTTPEAVLLRNALWADDTLLDAFVRENPAGLSADALAVVADWKHRRAGMFAVWKHYKKHTIFLLDREAFAVLGLRSTLEEILPQAPPLLVDTVLLPFEGVIVTDGLLTSRNILLGPGFRRSFKAAYTDAVERGAVRTSLLAPGPEVETGQRKAGRGATNRKVLSALRSYLYGQKRLREATVERDLRVIGSFAEGLPDGRSLRECNLDDVEAMVAMAATLFGGRAETVAALKRFFTFMLETGRVDPGLGEAALEWLRERGTKA